MKKILSYVAGIIVALVVIGFAATSVISANSRKSNRVVASADRIALRSNYHRDARTVAFNHGRKGATVTLLNGKKTCVIKYNVKKAGRFTIDLSAKEAKTLSKCSTFKYTVATKGYKAYSHTAPVCK